MSSSALKNRKVIRGAIQPHFAVSLFTLLVVGACFIMMLFVLDQGEQRAVREQEERTKLLAHTVENAVIRSFQDVIGRLKSIEDSLLLNPDLLLQDSETLHGILEDLLAQTPSLREVTVHGVAGNWVTSSRGRAPVSPEKALQCANVLMGSDLADFQILKPQPGRYLGAPASPNGLLHLPVCVALQDELGGPLATVTGTMNPDYLQELFRPSHELNPVMIELYDYLGSFLVHGEGGRNQLLLQSHQESLFDSRLREAEFGTFHQLHDAKETDQPRQVITGYRSTSQLPLVVLVHLDLDQGLRAWHKESDIIFWIFVGLISAIGVGGSIVVFSLARKHRLEKEVRLLSTAISSTANAIFITDQKGQIQWVNTAFEKLTGWKQHEVSGKNPRILNSGEHDERFFQKVWKTILSGQVWRGQITNAARDGHSMIVDQTITPIVNAYGEVSNFVAVHEDVTQRTEAENKARYLALHDPLTGLPNRHSFGEALDRILQGDSTTRLVVFFVDLDHFKTINDTLGHQAGDEVLRVATRRMGQVLPANAQLFRLGGDEFSILIHGFMGVEEVKQVALDILGELAQQMEFGDSHFTLSGSIGITFGCAGASAASTLLKQADMAMYKAKHSGRNTFSFFDENMDYLMQRHVELEQGMRDALSSDGGFKLIFQPVVDAFTHAPVSVEVLLRWQNRHGEWISPAEFIPVAEDIGLILELGKWQIDQLFERLGCWKNEILSHLHVSLNVSAVQLARDDIAEFLIQRMSGARISPEQIVVEVTETALMSDSTKVFENLKLLRDCGIRLSIDDFGTGYSSLKYISELEAHVLKIDRSFVMQIGQRKSDEEVIMATVALARNLGMAVVAEGVETVVQMEFLMRIGVDYLQGFYFAKPMYEGDLIDYIASVDAPSIAAESASA